VLAVPAFGQVHGEVTAAVPGGAGGDSDEIAAQMGIAPHDALLLITREAIRNAIYHGAPAGVAVRLTFGTSFVRLDVQDDGCGFEPVSACLAAEGHFGILGMRERMEQLGGSLEVTSSPGKGTTVTARLPLGNAV